MTAALTKPSLTRKPPPHEREERQSVKKSKSRLDGSNPAGEVEQLPSSQYGQEEDETEHEPNKAREAKLASQKESFQQR